MNTTTTNLQAPDRLAGMDFAAHNAEVVEVWKAYGAGRPSRTPIMLGTNTRYFMLDAHANDMGVGFEDYTNDPDLMFDVQLRFERWKRFNLLQDAPLGPPERWRVRVDLQNFYEAAWFGCPIEYMDDQVPDTRPAFTDEPERVMEKGMPDPLSGVCGMAWSYYERFRERAERETYLDRPIEVDPGGLGESTDGVMTVACNLFGADFVCTAMVEEPQRLNTLFDFITQATIERSRALRQRIGTPFPVPRYGFADDSIALISTEMYRQHVLPHHRTLCDAMSDEQPRCIHLCGNATRHFKTIRDELNVMQFDTGFPVDFAALRRELGPEVRIQGGPHVELLLTATPDQVRDETRRIMTSGVLEGGLFVLREGNNLAPCTPLENTEKMYHTGRELGRLTA